MAPSFASLRSRLSDRRAEFDHRYGDSSISAPNEGATWVEWTTPPASPEPKEVSTSRPSSPRNNDQTKASITITINLPWQKKSRSRSASLPPDNRRELQTPSAPVTRHVSQVSRQHARPNAHSPVPLQSSSFSPKMQQGSARSSLENSSRRPSSPPHSGTPALSILSPLTESFDDPQTPASVASDFMTSFENSPSSPVKHPALDDEFMNPRKSPVPHARKLASPDLRCRSPPMIQRAQSTLHARYVPDTPEEYYSARRSPPLERPTRRAQSVEPTMQRCRGSDEVNRHRRRISDTCSDADDDDYEVEHRSRRRPEISSRRSSSTSRQRHTPRYAQTVKNHHGTYSEVAKDYSRIIRAVEAENRSGNSPHLQQGQVSSRKKPPAQPKPANLHPGSAGSGFSFTSDEGYASGPQTLVPNEEDLWG